MLPLNLEQIYELFKIEQLLGFVLIGLINAGVMLLVSYKFFQIVPGVRNGFGISQ